MTHKMMAFFQLFSKAFWTERNWLALWGNLPFQLKANNSSQTMNSSISGSLAHCIWVSTLLDQVHQVQKKKKDNSLVMQLGSPRLPYRPPAPQSSHFTSAPPASASSASNVKTRSRLRSTQPRMRGPRGAGTKTSENTGGGEMGRHVI